MRLMITGTSGYIGGVLAERFAQRSDVTAIVTVDRRLPPWSPAADPKIHNVHGDLQDGAVIAELERLGPYDGIVHAAFHMRAGYGRLARAVEESNIRQCDNVFGLAFRSSVPRLVYFSSASVYGAKPGNVASHLFTEDEPLREDVYPYGVQKRRTEENLRRMHERQGGKTQVGILRPCSVTGPFRSRAGTKRASLIAFMRDRLPFIPEVTIEWARQFVHEADVYEAVALLLRQSIPRGYAAFNVSPSDYLLARDIARLLGKRVVRVPEWLMNLGLNAAWHGTRGRIPTPPGSIEFYKYPINLDSSNLARFGLPIKRPSSEALLSTI